MFERTAASSLAISVLILASPLKCQATTTSDDIDVATLTDQIILKELDLFKLNTTIKLNMLPRSPWSARRWATVGATNNVLTAVGALQTGAGRFYWLNTTRRARNNYFATAARSRVIANCLSVGGATVELAADRLAAWKEHQNGTDLRSVRRQAIALNQEIDDLLIKRATAIKPLNSDDPDRPVIEQEGVVLHDMRDLASNEFARFYAQSKGGRLTRNLGYIISMLSNAESGAGSAYTSCYAPFQTRRDSRIRTRNGGVGGITDIVSGGLNIAAPFLSRTGGALERMSARTSVCRKLDCSQATQLIDLQQHQSQLAAALKERPLLSVKAELLHQQALHSEFNILNQHEALRRSEQKAARSRFIENVINSGVSGGTKIANGIGGTVGAFHYTRRARARFMTTGEAAIAYGAGNAFSAMETLRNQFWNELNSKRAHDQHRNTEQILKDQIAELDMKKKAIKQRSGVKFATAPDQSVE